jgi:polysaccharide export outer membrane protein
MLMLAAALAAGFNLCGSPCGAAQPSSSAAGTPTSLVVGTSTIATSTNAVAPAARYRLQPGDLLTVSVWKEKDLQADVLVRPDGGLSFPLAGDINALGLSVEELQATLAERLKRFIPDPVVSVAVKTIGGNQVYVIGKVNRPGEFAFSRPLDVMQALALAGGATPFAELNDIVILRRENGGQRALSFRFGDVERGRGLHQNVLLQSGDTVVVP